MNLFNVIVLSVAILSSTISLHTQFINPFRSRDVVNAVVSLGVPVNAMLAQGFMLEADFAQFDALGCSSVYAGSECMRFLAESASIGSRAKPPALFVDDSVVLMPMIASGVLSSVVEFRYLQCRQS